jgi:hypothetical protein
VMRDGGAHANLEVVGMRPEHEQIHGRDRHSALANGREGAR